MMTTPTYFGSVNRAIEDAYWNSGLVARGLKPSSQQYADALNTFNGIVNFWQTRGLKLFTNADVPLTLQLGIYQYEIGPSAAPGIVMTKPMRVVLGYFLNPNAQQIPLTAASWQEWIILPHNNSQGQPVQYFVDKQATQLNVGLWPTPDAFAILGSVHLILQQQVTGAVSLTDAISFPSEWYLGLMWTLTVELAQGQPPEILQHALSQRNFYMNGAEEWDVEDAQSFFAPDPRGSYYASNFS